MSNSITFGPIPSRRFGISLGIDLSSNKKQCNFDCLYCELKPAKTMDKMSEYPSVKKIINEVKKSVEKYPKIDVVTITANGEPTLYPNLDLLIQELLKIDVKILILSNGSTIYKKEIFDALLKLDMVKLSLDCVSRKCFKKLDRVHKNIEIDKIIPSMIEFSKEFKNDFILEILFVKDLNDSKEEIALLYEAIKKINPTRVDIGTIDRPPAYKVKAVSFETLESIANCFKGINVNIAYKNRPKFLQTFNKEEIISMLNRRPLTFEDVENMYDEISKKELEILLKDGKICIVDSSGLKFYKIL